MSEQWEIIKKLNEKEQNLKLQIKGFDEIMVTQNQLRKFHHDYSNLIIGLKSYIGNKDYKGATEYIDKLSAKINYRHQIIQNVLKK